MSNVPVPRTLAGASGIPGIGFNCFIGNTSVDHGFTHFEVETDDD
jgi:hypothetical protein